MPELRRTQRLVTTNRDGGPFSPSETVEEEDDYTIEAETTGEICVILEAIEGEVDSFESLPELELDSEKKSANGSDTSETEES